MSEENIIRNPTPEEIQELTGGGQNSVKAKNKKKDRETNDTIDHAFQAHPEYDAMIQNKAVKPQVSMFEPKPVAFKLCSVDKVIEKRFLTSNNEIFVRRFGTLEESILSGALSKNLTEMSMLKAVSDMIDSCIKTNISVDQLSVVDQEALFEFLVCLSYGQTIDLTHKAKKMCKRCCDTKDTVSIDSSDLKTKYFDEKINNPIAIKLTSYPDCDITVYLKIPDIGMQQKILTSQKDLMVAIKIMLHSIEGSKQNGKAVVKQEWDQIINYLNDTDRKTINDKMAEISDYGIRFGEYKNFTCTNTNCDLLREEIGISVTMEDILRKMITSQVQNADLVEAADVLDNE